MGQGTKLFPLAAVLLVAVFLRFFLIIEIPPGLYPDEAANGNNALEAIANTDFSAKGGPALGWKIFYPENNGREGLFINLQAISVAAFGAEPWALRVVSALIGTLTVLGIYLLTKELFHGNNFQFSIFNSQSNPNDSTPKLFGNWKLEIGNCEVALLAAFFLATSYWHINFSRIGFRAIMVPFFAVFGMYWLLKALRTGKISSAVLGGLAAGLGLHTYIAFRFMPFVFVVPVLFALRQWWKRGANSNPLTPRHCVPCVIALFLFVAFLAAIPLGLYFLGHPADFFGRGGQVSIFSAESPLAEFAKSTVLTLGMFSVWGDCNQRHNLDCKPELFWPVGMFFLIGLALTARSLFQKPLSPISYILFVWFLFLMLPATLTREGLPHALRSIGLIPPVMIFSALGAAWLWGRIERALDRAGANPANERYGRQLLRIKKELALAAILVLVWIPIATYRDYFIRFADSAATADAFAADLLHQGRYLASLPFETEKFVVVNLTGDDIRGVPAPAQTVMFATDTFTEAEREARRVRYVRRPEEISFDAGARVTILIMHARDRALVKELRQRFPDLQPRVPGDFLVLETQ